MAIDACDRILNKRKLTIRARVARTMFLILSIFVGLSHQWSVVALGAQQTTLGEVRKEFLDKEVIVFGTKASGFERLAGGIEVFLGWSMAVEDKPGHYASRISEHAPYSYKGQRGKVVAIQLADSLIGPTKRSSSKDVFGDPVSDDQVVDPYLLTVVKMGDGTLIANTSYPSTLRHDLELSGIIQAERQEIITQIERLPGRKLYTVAYSALYPADADISTLTDRLRITLHKIGNMPGLTPLTITKVQYLTSEHAVIAKVQFPEGRTGIAFLPYRIYGPPQVERMALPFLQKLAWGPYGFLTEIPKSLTKAEIEAIRSGSVLKGMSKEALRYSIGFPDKENDWGAGGKQLMYGKSLLVYTKGDTVVDWQSFGR